MLVFAAITAIAMASWINLSQQQAVQRGIQRAIDERNQQFRKIMQTLKRIEDK